MTFDVVTKITLKIEPSSRQGRKDCSLHAERLEKARLVDRHANEIPSVSHSAIPLRFGKSSNQHQQVLNKPSVVHFHNYVSIKQPSITLMCTCILHMQDGVTNFIASRFVS